jgi:hypothetical protein
MASLRAVPYENNRKDKSHRLFKGGHVASWYDHTITRCFPPRLPTASLRQYTPHLTPTVACVSSLQVAAAAATATASAAAGAGHPHSVPGVQNRQSSVLSLFDMEDLA